MRKVLALRRRLGKRTTTTGLIALPFLFTILLFVVAPALGLSSASMRSSTSTTQSTTGYGQSTSGDTSTGLTPTTGDTSTTGTDSSCPSSSGDTTTGQTTTTGPGLTTPGQTTTGQTTTGQTTTTRHATSKSTNKSKSKNTSTTTTTGDTSTTSTTPDQGTSTCPASSCPPAGPTSTDQGSTTGQTTTGQTTTSPLPSPPGQTTTGQTTTDNTSTDQMSLCNGAAGPDANSPAAKYSVLNGTVNVATDHERIGSSAFPNFTNGAVDNYYSLAHAHVDGSPFAEGTASPGDTGPVGQTAAAGNTQQPQYADARWPGDSASGNATFGNQGGPYAVASASDYSAKAESELASNSSSGSSNAPNAATAIGGPKGFNGRLKAVLAKWKAKWLGRLHLKPLSPSRTGITAPAVRIPSLPAVPVTPPAVTTPTIPGLGSVPSPTLPTVTVPSVTVPPLSAPKATVPSLQGPQAAPAPSRSLAAASGTSTTGTTTSSTTTTDTSSTTTGTTTTTPGDSGPPPDGGSLLKSTSSVELDPTTNALVTTGESSLGLVSLGSGQIVLEGIHVKASITNVGIKPPDSGDGSSTGTDTTGTTTTPGSTTTGSTTTSPFPTGTDTGTTTTTDTTTTAGDTSASNATYKVSVRIASASIGGVPVTIDQDGVHVASQGGALPYQQASDALNSALKQAGIQIFMVGPEIKTTDGEQTIDATGVHVYFTQPVSGPGAPAQFAEHVLGEVYLDSLAVLAPPMPKFDSLGGLGATGGKTKLGGATKHGAKPKLGSAAKSGVAGVSGGSSGSGATASGSFGSSSGGFPSGSSGSLGGSSQPTASSPTGPTGSAAPAGFVSTLKKPVWLLIAFLIWIGLTGVSGWSVWKWRQEGGGS